MDDRRWGVGIRALDAGGRPDPTVGARVLPVGQTQTTSFVDMTFVTAGRAKAFVAAMRAAAKAFSHAGAMHGFVFGVAARNLSQVV